MSKKDNLEDVKVSKDKPKKKKMTKHEKRKMLMKVVGWIMAFVIIFGSLISIFGMLIYY